MKWIQWDGMGGFGWRDTCPVPARDYPFVGYLNQEDIDCEKDTSWREIESGVLDTKTGKLCITLKPVQNVPTLREAVEAYRQKLIEAFGVDEWQGNSSFKQAIFDALDREVATPANPYTKEAVDELLDAMFDHNSDWFHKERWLRPETQRVATVLAALKKQREAANA